MVKNVILVPAYKKPLDCVRAEDILKIEYGRKTVWENPTSAQKVKGRT